MPKSLDELLVRVNQSEIATIKATLSKIIEVIHNPDSSVMDLKNLIEIDHPLAANVLRLANSALYGMRRGISSVMEAIILIGYDAVVELTLNQKFFQLFQNSGQELLHGYTRRTLWEHSIGVALCSKLIYRREFRKNGGDMYTAGLIHDIGIIIEDQFLHSDFFSILTDMKKNGSGLHQAEIGVLGYCHEDIGERLAASWNFPRELCQVIGKAERLEVGDESASLMAGTLYVANCACNRREVGFSELSFVDQPLYEDCLNRLQIKERALDFIMDEVEEQIAQMKKDGWF
ncbi:MAG: HDOD domain protein [Syntrophus sp. PtaB.Bin001]|nr:MAG: HDOD domain protein [Syntrophus sp. PtaB.Bin001]